MPISRFGVLTKPMPNRGKIHCTPVDEKDTERKKFPYGREQTTSKNSVSDSVNTTGYSFLVAHHEQVYGSRAGKILW